MTTPRTPATPRTRVFSRRNTILLVAAVVSLVAGYAILRAGHPSAAAVFLVAGYCVLFPLAIAL